MNPFKIDVELPTEEFGGGKVRLAFQVPYMWFGFWQRPGMLGFRTMSTEEKECNKRDVAQKFGHMVAEEILRCWPEEK